MTTASERAVDLRQKLGLPIFLIDGKETISTSQIIEQFLQSERRLALEEAAKVAEAHKGSAAKDRGKKRYIREPDAYHEIHAEERGEDMASEMIARKIRALASAGEKENGR